MDDGALVIGIMASFSPRPFSVQELLALTRPFDVSPSSLRTNLSRLKKKGVLSREQRGGDSVYSLSAKGTTITGNVAAGFHRPDWQGWDGTFWGIGFSLPAAAKSERYRLTKKLSLFRFAPFYPGFWIRPCRERERMEEKLRSIFTNPRCTAVRFRPWQPLTKERIGEIWDISDVSAALQAAATLAEKTLLRIESAPPEKAFRERYVTGERIIAALFRDPLLPPAFLPRPWPADKLRGLFKKFDASASRISKPFWQDILKQGGNDDHH